MLFVILWKLVSEFVVLLTQHQGFAEYRASRGTGISRFTLGFASLFILLGWHLGLFLGLLIFVISR